MSNGFHEEAVNKEKVHTVLHEFKQGRLHSGPGRKRKAKSWKQALAIALSEGRKAAK